MVVLADMPCLSVDLIETLIKHSQSDRITIPQFEGRRGHPVLFGSDFIPDLSQMSGDIGARELIKSHSNSVDLIEMRDNGCLLDLDNAEDWRSYQASRN
jgi:molybdenum cofactor cytidylyltransferase